MLAHLGTGIGHGAYCPGMNAQRVMGQGQATGFSIPVVHDYGKRYELASTARLIPGRTC